MGELLMNGGFVPLTDNQAAKMLQPARMAAMRKLRRGDGRCDERPEWAVRNTTFIYRTLTIGAQQITIINAGR
jgi:hypothetical protein